MTTARTPVQRACEVCGQAFTPRSWERNRRFCSHRCQGNSLRTPVTCTCVVCGTSFARRPSEIAAGAGKYCSKECSEARPRKAALVHTCEQCGKQRTFSGARRSRALRQRFCSRACRGKAQRRRVECVCQLDGCGKTFERPRSDTSNGRGRYCSRAHADAAKRRPVERTCERCREPFTVPPSFGNRRFCSRACYLGTIVGYQDVACVVCGTPRRVHRSVLARGHGRFCSRACYFRHRGQGRVNLSCQRPSCSKPFTVPTSASQQRYCSRACADADQGRATRRFKCRRCRSFFTVPAWRRRPQFCTLKCANNGRKRTPHPDDVTRNGRILELHAGGQSSRQIAAAIGGLTPEAVRQILARARRAVASA